MEKVILWVFFILFLLMYFWVASPEAAERYKVLEYKYNQATSVFISNAPCIQKELAKQYTHFAFAKRADGATLKGCFNNKGNMVVIQWIGGDRSEFDADLFLLEQ